MVMNFVKIVYMTNHKCMISMNQGNTRIESWKKTRENNLRAGASEIDFNFEGKLWNGAFGIFLRKIAYFWEKIAYFWEKLHIFEKKCIFLREKMHASGKKYMIWKSLNFLIHIKKITIELLLKLKSHIEISMLDFNFKSNSTIILSLT